MCLCHKSYVLSYISLCAGVVAVCRCGHSKQFLPTFEVLANELASHNVAAAKVDCVQHPELYWQNEIDGFPQLKAFFGDGNYNRPVHYKGDRSYDDVLEFVRKQFVSSVIEPDLKQEDFTYFTSDFLKPTAPVLIMYTPSVEGSIVSGSGESSRGSDDNTVIHQEKIARLEFICKQLDFLKCAFSTDEALAADLGINPAMTKFAMIRQFESEQSIASIPVPLSVRGQDDLKSVAWAHQSAFPLLVEFEEANESLMFSENRHGYRTHIVFVLHSSSEKFDAQTKMLRELAKLDEFIGKCVFVYIDADKAGKSLYVDNLLKDLKVTDTSVPSVRIVRSMKTAVQFYEFDNSSNNNDLDRQALHNWIVSFQQQTIEPTREINIRGQ
jgi:hypothetical protein